MDDSGKRAVGQLGEYGTMQRPGDRPFSEILSDIVAHAQEIIRSEIRLAKVELREEVIKAARAGIMLAVGVVAGLFAMGLFLWTVVYALQLIMPIWAATLIVGFVLAVPAGAMTIVGLTRIAEVHPAPAKAVQEVKEDVQWLKQQTK